eukprot:5597875-Pleurochrysis_carterae.AAC.5
MFHPGAAPSDDSIREDAAGEALPLPSQPHSRTPLDTGDPCGLDNRKDQLSLAWTACTRSLPGTLNT